MNSNGPKLPAPAILFKSRARRAAMLSHLLIVGALGMSAHTSRAATAEGETPRIHQRVWFNPDNDTEDFVNMFEKPEAWTNSRSRIQVFKFGPQQVRDKNQPPMNPYDELVKVDAFKKLRDWGIDVAIEAPSIKPWDCTAVKARQKTVDYIKDVKKAGGLVKYIVMDEPLNSALGKCNLSFDEALNETATYIKELSADPELRALGTPVMVGDCAGWPWLSVEQIKRWVKGLEAKGAKPAFFHLDANIHRLDNDRKVDERRDLRELQQFMRGESIPFGVILWPGYNPVNSNANYYERTIAWTRRVHAAIGKPDDIVVQSWVTLGGHSTCANTDVNCSMTNPHCTPSDPKTCGKQSVPINLPENDPRIMSHTRLLLESLDILGAKSP